ncbi:MAG: DUF6778 family protein [Pseudomonadota bacterium]
MKKLARFLALAGTLFVAACASTSGPVNDTVSGWNLTDVSVRFGPNIERTADGNTFSQNFVWNGLEEGNRKKQVIALFKTAMAEMSETAMTGPQPVKMAVRVNYFHALTEFSRVWCCGEHRIYADLTVTDAESGNVLMQGENVYLGRLALGGVPGLVANAAGRDQYVRVKEGIVKRTREWLAGER